MTMKVKMIRRLTMEKKIIRINVITILIKMINTMIEMIRRGMPLIVILNVTKILSNCIEII